MRELCFRHHRKDGWTVWNLNDWDRGEEESSIKT